MMRNYKLYTSYCWSFSLRSRVAMALFLTFVFAVWMVFPTQHCYRTELNPKYLNMEPTESGTLSWLFASKGLHTSSSISQKTFDPSEKITLVTAYFKLDSFKKGFNQNQNSDTYKRWASAYSRVLNPLILYTDSIEFLIFFEKLRSDNLKNITKLILVKRENLWAFNLRHRIAKIFNQSNYPKFHPNTVIPDYSCVMHAKYELLKKSIEKNYFGTTYYMWIDIGYFRYEVGKSNWFGLNLPQGFDIQHVAYSKVCDFQKDIPLKQIIWDNRVWVAGGANLGRYDLLSTFCQEYIARVERALNDKLMSTDQQIIYAMYTDKDLPKTRLQLCHNSWFCLGYLSIKSWQDQNSKADVT